MTVTDEDELDDLFTMHHILLQIIRAIRLSYDYDELDDMIMLLELMLKLEGTPYLAH